MNICRAKGNPHLTPEFEVLNFGFEVSYVCDLRAVLAERKERVKYFIIQKRIKSKSLLKLLYVLFRTSPSFNLYTGLDNNKLSIRIGFQK